MSSTRFFQSYLFSFLFWMDLPLGALFLLMVYHLTGGAWGAASRRILEAMSDTIKWMSLLFVPVLLGMHQIYPWLDPMIASDPKIAHKSAYLNATGFGLRAVIYFSSWILLNHFLQVWSGGHEKDADLETSAKLRSLSAGGCVVYVLTASFAAFDWQMSLEPLWYSTIYGLIFCTAQVLLAYAFSLVVCVILSRRLGYVHLFATKTLRDLGNLLLAFVMVWTYLSLMQFLVVWSGNLPEEVTWYLRRTGGAWLFLAVLLVTLQFALPFATLLFRRTKDHAWLLGTLGSLIFLTRIIDRYWTVMPAFYPASVEFHWLDPVTFLGIGGIWFAAFLRRLRMKPVFATNDPDWPLTKKGVSHAQ